MAEVGSQSFATDKGGGWRGIIIYFFSPRRKTLLADELCRNLRARYEHRVIGVNSERLAPDQVGKLERPVRKTRTTVGSSVPLPNASPNIASLIEPNSPGPAL